MSLSFAARSISTALNRHFAVLVFLVYAGILFAVLPYQSLWLDELMQTAVCRFSPVSKLLEQDVPRTAGQVPLAYLLQKFSMLLLGYSAFSARLPPAILSLLSCLGMYRLANSAKTDRPWLCLLLFATVPLQVRYAAEARPYSQALCISIWLTVVFLKLLVHPRKRTLLVYTALCVAGLYTQPFTLFVVIAHLAFAFLFAAPAKKLLLVITVSVILFLPWYLFARAGWRGDVNASNLHFHIHRKLPLELLRELTGAGYAGTFLIVALSVYGFACSSLPRTTKWFWALLAIVPGLLALSVDATLDYFFAIRQIIFVLPPLILLTALGLETLHRAGRLRLALFLTVLLLLLNTSYSIRWFTKPREDWGTAAARLDRARDSRACLIFAPTDSVRLYEFYVPGLERSVCSSTSMSRVNKVYLSISPYYRGPPVGDTFQRTLEHQGFSLTRSANADEPRILVFTRRDR